MVLHMQIPWRCVACGGDLDQVGDSLNCSECGASYDLRDGFAFFDGGPAEQDLDQAAYQQFLLSRARMKIRDQYAAFQPFNEANRTWLAFKHLIERVLEPGDIILDIGNRTGWTGAELAAAFPEQIVLSCWDGDRDVLGHRGYRYWFGSHDKPSNLHFAFLPLQKKLPLANKSVKLVHGHDVLHHLELQRFLPELQRVLDKRGCALFPHVHTSDAEPDPWFQRGGTLRSCAEYRETFERICNDKQMVEVIGEARLFTKMADGGISLGGPSAAHDWNAIVGLFPVSWKHQTLSLHAPDKLINQDDVLLVNPLVTVDPTDGTVSVDATPNAYAEYLLTRHPVYCDTLQKSLLKRLTESQRLIMYWAHRMPNLGAIADKLKIPFKQLSKDCEILRDAELLAVKKIDPTSARLQRSHIQGNDLPCVNEDHPQILWDRAVTCFPDKPCLIMSSLEAQLSYAEANEVVEAMARRMRALNFKTGDAVLIAFDCSIETLLFVWASVMRNVTVVVCDPQAEVPNAIKELSVKAVFANNDKWRIDGAVHICPDESNLSGWTPMPEWYQDEDFAGPDPRMSPSDSQAVGAILFTSGSTNKPKAVQLSWSGLARSARNLAHHYEWSDTDRLLNLGGLHTMSGLRNPAFAAISVGAAIVEPPGMNAMHAVSITEIINQHAVSVLGAAPATLQTILTLGDRAGRLEQLRLALLTGSQLPLCLRTRFNQQYPDTKICNYYGLTETCGFCLGDRIEDDHYEGIGVPVDALLKIIDESGNELERGQEGELLIHSSSMMIGYLGAEPLASSAWYHTGDLARMTNDGACMLVGRKRDIVKNNFGEIVSCAEITDTILDCEGVLDAAVTASTDAQGLECARAWIVPENTNATHEWLDELRLNLFERLGPRKTLSYMELCEAIPRTSNGKPQFSKLESL